MILFNFSDVGPIFRPVSVNSKTSLCAENGFSRFSFLIYEAMRVFSMKLKHGYLRYKPTPLVAMRIYS